MPSIDWFWFIAGIIVGKFALDFVYMLVMNIFQRISGRSSTSVVGA